MPTRAKEPAVPPTIIAVSTLPVYHMTRGVLLLLTVYENQTEWM